MRVLSSSSMLCINCTRSASNSLRVDRKGLLAHCACAATLRHCVIAQTHYLYSAVSKLLLQCAAVVLCCCANNYAFINCLIEHCCNTVITATHSTCCTSKTTIDTMLHCAVLQAPYNFGEAQIGVKLQKGKYLIIPSLYRRGTHGGFYLSVYTSSKATKLQNGVRITAEHEASHSHQNWLIVQRGGEEMTLQHANAHSERVREKLLREAARLGITTLDIERAFYGQAAVSSMTTLPPAPAATATVASGANARCILCCTLLLILTAHHYTTATHTRPNNIYSTDSKTAATTNSNSSSAVKPVRAASRLTGTDITRTEFKRHLMALGFNLTDFPDTDFAVLDADNSGAISKYSTRVPL
eukprot:16375-Heterococcus_DN1.PRE.1